MCLEELKQHRSSLDSQIEEESNEKSLLQKEINRLTESLSRLNKNLEAQYLTKNEYDNAIQETEGAYNKILESSHTLLHVLKRESANLARESP